MRIYVGNINYATDEKRLQEVFGDFGPVTNAAVITDRDTQRSKGFAFLEMPDVEGQAAITALHETELDGRVIRVSVAQERVKKQQPRELRPDRRDKNNYGW